jgi:hypothetical protein
MEYNVVFSEQLRQRIAALVGEAEVQGQGPQAREAVRSLVARLRTAPQSLGELKFFTVAGEEVHQRVISPFSFWYAIYEEHRVVWVTRVDRLSALGE